MEEHIYTFRFPDIGEGVVEGEVIEWLKKPGDQVKQDEPVVVVMTDKATVELPSPYPGTVVKHYYQPGQIAIKDQPLYDIKLEESFVLPQAPTRPEVPSTPPVQTLPTQPTRGGKVLAVPKVRRMAKEIGIDIEGIRGSGKEGRILAHDLAQGLKTEREMHPLLTLEGDEEHPLIGVRGMMARRMHERAIPQFSYFEQAVVSRLIQLRQNMKPTAEAEGIQLSFMPFFIRALSLTAKRFPAINASVDMKESVMVVHKVQNIGIAMASEHGLVVPVLKGVESMGLHEIIRGYGALREKATTGKLQSSDMKGATITISNFGAVEGEVMWATPMINEPETVIVALARMRKAPVAVADEVVVKDILPVSWSFDHRVIDGELAAHVSHYFATLLKDPAGLL